MHIDFRTGSISTTISQGKGAMGSRLICERMGGGKVCWFCVEAAGLSAVALVAAGCMGVGVEVVYGGSRQSSSSVVVGGGGGGGGSFMIVSSFPPGF